MRPITPAPVKDTLLSRRFGQLSKLQKNEKEAPAPRQRILAVDDNQDTLELIRMTLEQEYDIVTVANPLDFYELAELYEPDLLIIDVMMPKVNGFQLIEMLQRHQKLRQIPVIVLSAKNSVKDIKHGYKLGASLYLTKPFASERLLKNVKTQFELRPPQDAKKKLLTISQVQLQLELKQSYRDGFIHLSADILKKENISRQRKANP